MKPITFTLSGTADQALDVGSYAVRQYPYRCGFGYRVKVIASPEVARLILDHARYRAECSEFDQPAHWRPACRRAAAVIEAAIEGGRR